MSPMLARIKDYETSYLAKFRALLERVARRSPFVRIAWRYLSNPIPTIFVACLMLCTVIFLASFHVRAYNSDDVVWQNALLFWRPFHHQIFYSDGGATYLAKLPIYWLISKVMSPGRGALMVAGLLFTLVNFTMVYFSTVYLMRRARLRTTWLTLLPFVWLASFGFGVTSQFIADSLHNVEIGCIFLTFALLVKIYSDHVSLIRSYSTAAWAVAFALFMGLNIINDHYYLFICTLPAIAFVVGTSLLKLPLKRQNLQVFILLVASLGISKVVEIIATKAGIVFLSGLAGSSTPQLIGFETLLTNFIVALHSLMIVFGADFWGRLITQGLVYVCLANAILLVVIISYGIRLSKTLILRLKTNETFSLKITIPILLWAVIACAFLLYVVSTLSYQTTNSFHYMMVAPYFAVPLLCWLCATRTVSRYLYILMGVAIVLNTGSVILGVHDPNLVNEPYGTILTNSDQAYNMRLIAYLESHGLTKGFGGYVDGNINTYLSGGVVDIMPTVCSANGPQIFRFLFTESQLAKPATQTFYVYNPAPSPFATECTPSQVEAALGQPTKILHSQGDTILVYPYDISAKVST